MGIGFTEESNEFGDARRVEGRANWIWVVPTHLIQVDVDIGLDSSTAHVHTLLHRDVSACPSTRINA